MNMCHWIQPKYRIACPSMCCFAWAASPEQRWRWRKSNFPSNVLGWKFWNHLKYTSKYYLKRGIVNGEIKCTSPLSIVTKPFFFLLNTLSLLSPSVFKHQTTTRSPPVHPQNTHLLRVSLTHRKELMTLACDYNSLWRSPAAPLQKHTQAAVCAET